MENKVEKYVHDEFGELEVMQVGDKFWFPARKCAEILGHQNPERAVRNHCKGVTEMVTQTLHSYFSVYNFTAVITNDSLCVFVILI